MKRKMMRWADRLVFLPALLPLIPLVWLTDLGVNGRRGGSLRSWLADWRREWLRS